MKMISDHLELFLSALIVKKHRTRVCWVERGEIGLADILCFSLSFSYTYAVVEKNIS